MFSCAWLWMYIGAFLMLGELLAPGFVIFVFGLAAATVGACRFAFGEAFTATWQLAAFSAFSILYLVVLRRWVKSVFTGDVSSRQGLKDEMIGRPAQVIEEIAPGKLGRILVGDAEWSASSDVAIAAGSSVTVVGRENLTLKVLPA